MTKKFDKRRRDKNGVLLQKGEGQRKDGRYYFRENASSKTIYAKTLEELREKVKQYQRDVADGINTIAGKTHLIDLVKHYISQKVGVKYNTQQNYAFVLNVIKDIPISKRAINSIKTPEIKAWCIELKKYYSYSSITTIHSVLRGAMDIAVQYDYIRKNPFDFKLGSIIKNDSQKRIPLTQEEQKRLLEFVRNDKTAARYYNEVVILLNTGLRISELYGLTIADIDFQGNRIHVHKQLQRDKNCRYFVETTKTSAGNRYVPMNNTVVEAFKDVLSKRSTESKHIIDGYKDFVFLDTHNKPKVAGHLQHAMKRFIDRYNLENPHQPLIVTPHILRHTFCTNMYLSNLSIKSLQYIMGHDDISTTLGIYTQANYTAIADDFYQALAQ